MASILHVSSRGGMMMKIHKLNTVQAFCPRSGHLQTSHNGKMIHRPKIEMTFQNYCNSFDTIRNPFDIPFLHKHRFFFFHPNS